MKAILINEMEELKMNKAFIKVMVILFAIVCLFGFTRVAVIQAEEKNVEEEILDILNLVTRSNFSKKGGQGRDIREKQSHHLI